MVTVKIEDLEQEITKRYEGLNLVYAYAENSYFYNPTGELPGGVYFATLKESDGQNDKASGLNREGVYRLSFGVTKKSYEKLFGVKPSRPAKGGVVDTGHDFMALNILTPHPVYAWIGWVAILNPQREQHTMLCELLDEKYEVVKKEYGKRVKRPL